MKPHLTIVYAAIVLVSAFLGTAFFVFHGDPEVETTAPPRPVTAPETAERQAARKILQEHADFVTPAVPLASPEPEATQTPR